MDKSEFYRILDLFPVVRPRDYYLDSDPTRQTVSQAGMNEQVLNTVPTSNSFDVLHQDGSQEDDTENEGSQKKNMFWEKLKVAAEKKVGPAEADKFCEAFQLAYKKLVNEELSLDAARGLVSSSKDV